MPLAEQWKVYFEACCSFNVYRSWLVGAKATSGDPGSGPEFELKDFSPERVRS